MTEKKLLKIFLKIFRSLKIQNNNICLASPCLMPTIYILCIGTPQQVLVSFCVCSTTLNVYMSSFSVQQFCQDMSLFSLLFVVSNLQWIFNMNTDSSSLRSLSKKVRNSIHFPRMVELFPGNFTSQFIQVLIPFMFYSI